jgi:RNA polymerase sigma factor (sigma-70 family)
MAMSDNEPADSALLREFLHERSEAAFRRLTARHVDLVFGTAQRRTNDRGAAEEITQNVFLALAKKAAWLQSEPTIAGWLHRTAVLEATQWWRGELRRRQREETAAKLETTMKTSDCVGVSDLAGALDEALLDLRDGERQAVLLRYFEGRNNREIGAALGIGEDAARKRVDKALDQIAAFFRKRGHAIGGGTAAAALLSGSSQAAPVWLAAGVSGRVLSLAMPSGAGLLAQLLGMTGLQMAMLSLLIVGVPATWQTTRLLSAREEQRRLESLMAELQAQRRLVAEDWVQLRGQIGRVSNEVAAAETALRSTIMADGKGPDESDPRFFLWDENADFVRVPKSVLRRIRFDGSKDPWNLRTGSADTFDAERRRISPTVMKALGLDEGQQAAVQELFVKNLDAYREWSVNNSHLTDFPTLSASITNLSPGMTVNEGTRAWVTPSVPEDGAAWRKLFTDGLTSLIGPERAEILLRMAKDDGSLARALRRFGASSGFVLVTPQMDGRVLVATARVAQGRWVQGTFDMPATFSEVLSPPDWPAFDEAAARREIMEKIPLFRAQFPDKEVPPVSELVEKARQGWAMKRIMDHDLVLQEPLPPALTDYLRQWKAAHPEVPDAPRKTSTRKQP